VILGKAKEGVKKRYTGWVHRERGRHRFGRTPLSVMAAMDGGRSCYWDRICWIWRWFAIASALALAASLF